LTIRDSDKRVRVRHLGEHHWITKDNYCAMVVRGFIDESLGHAEPRVKLETGITFTMEDT
jgi:hypothetical protein